MLNKNFAKIRNDKLIYAPNPLVQGNKIISNPLAEDYINSGFMPIIMDAKPNEEGFAYTLYYEIKGKKIIKKWKAIELPIIDETQFNIEEE